MTSCPTTTLLPPSPPFDCLDDIVSSLVERCIYAHEDINIPESDKQQYFDYTMALIEFWDAELSKVLRRVN